MILLISIAMGVNIDLSGFFMALVFMILISVSFVSLGIVFASRMEDPHGFQMIMSFVMMPVFFLSGALFPLERLPLWLKSLTYLDPLTYGVDGLRGSLVHMNQFPLWLDFSVLLVFSIAMLSLGGYLFRSMEA
jgi:ABC-2 type transport system permease protein